MSFKSARRPQAPKDGGKAGQRRRTRKAHDDLRQITTFWQDQPLPPGEEQTQNDLQKEKFGKRALRKVGMANQIVRRGNVRRELVDPLEQELDWDARERNTQFSGLSDIWMVPLVPSVVARLKSRAFAANADDTTILAKGNLTVNDVHEMAKAESDCEWWCCLCDPTIADLADWEIELLMAGPRTSPQKPRRTRIRTRAGVRVEEKPVTSWRSESASFAVTPTLSCGCKGLVCRCAEREKSLARQERKALEALTRRKRTSTRKIGLTDYRAQGQNSRFRVFG